MAQLKLSLSIFFICLVLGTEAKLLYPPVLRDATTVDEYHGQKIDDPYRWLEDLKSDKTQHFIQDQQKLTQSFLETIPQRDEIHKRLTQVTNYPKSSAPEKAGSRLFHFENTGLQNQDVIYVKDEGGKEEVFLDPNTLSKDGSVSIGDYTFSWDGELFAYTTSQKGGDWQVIKVKNVSTRIDLEDEIRDVKFPYLKWTKQGDGFFYNGYPNGSSEQPADKFTSTNKIYYHSIGTTQDKDIVVAEWDDSPRLLEAEVSKCGNFLIIFGTLSFSSNTVHLLPIDGGIDVWSKNLDLIPVFTEQNHTYSYVTNEGRTFLFRTSKDAPNYKLITVTISLDRESITSRDNNGPGFLMSTFLDQHPKNVLSWVIPIGNKKLLMCYMNDVKDMLELRSLKDASLIHKFDLEVGSIQNIYEDGGNKSPLWGHPEKHNEIYISVKNFLSPGTIYLCQVEGQPECKISKTVDISNLLDVTKFTTEQVFYPSKDGTIIPMYIVKKKDTPLDGTAPTLLYGYGGFNIPILPDFSADALVFIDHFDGIFALANIRGGGEYGPSWHAAGSVLNKINSFDDFIAAGEYLVKNNYTKSSKLAIEGASNGGYLIGACVNLRPDLFGAAIAQVGVLDLLSEFTNGFVACAEYGCVKNKDQFESILKISPLQNIRLPANESVQYPAIFVTTADHDDRVPPSQSYKYISELQYTIGQSSRQTKPLLLRVDTNTGHGAGRPVTKEIAETADVYTFMAKTLELKFNPSP